MPQRQSHSIYCIYFAFLMNIRSPELCCLSLIAQVHLWMQGAICFHASTSTSSSDRTRKCYDLSRDVFISPKLSTHILLTKHPEQVYILFLLTPTSSPLKLIAPFNKIIDTFYKSIDTYFCSCTSFDGSGDWGVTVLPPTLSVFRKQARNGPNIPDRIFLFLENIHLRVNVME